jgi:hypothetical protein
LRLACAGLWHVAARVVDGTMVEVSMVADGEEAK